MSTPPTQELNHAVMCSLETTAQYAGPEVIEYMMERDAAGANGDTPVFDHCLRVAGLMEMAMPSGIRKQDRRRLRIGGVLHDIVRVTDPTIQAMVAVGSEATAEQMAVIRTHAPLGGRYISERLLPANCSAGGGQTTEKRRHKLSQGVATDVAVHHSPLPQAPRKDRECAAVLQVADRTDAMLLDWSPARNYKFQRMLGEGLLGDQLSPNIPLIADKILDNMPETALGIRLRHIVDLGIRLMPAFVPPSME